MLGVVHDSANPNSPFAKLKVRQALQHAIDGEAMAKTIYLGEAEAAKDMDLQGTERVVLMGKISFFCGAWDSG
jgi:ABC-type transport system substrate-binding protein